MAIAVVISAWLMFIIKLAIIAVASLASLAVLLVLFGAAAKMFRMHYAAPSTAPNGKVRIFLGADTNKE